MSEQLLLRTVVVAANVFPRRISTGKGMGGEYGAVAGDASVHFNWQIFDQRIVATRLDTHQYEKDRAERVLSQSKRGAFYHVSLQQFLFDAHLHDNCYR